MTNTALRAAGKMITNTISFRSKEHKQFYMEYLLKCRYQDAYHKALVYCLGIDRDTREHADRIYDFKTGSVKPECLQEGWQTSGSRKIIRMTFNLYCNSTPSICEYDDGEEQMRECQQYTGAPSNRLEKKGIGNRQGGELHHIHSDDPG